MLRWAQAMTAVATSAPETAVLHVGGLHYASEKAVVERVLGARPGVLSVEANPVAQTATVVYDPEATSIEELRRWVQECGYHCAGQSVPGHICDPLVEPDHGPHDHAAVERADEAHGHGHGGHAGMSMDAMVRDMRNRFVVALVFTVPIVLWSTVGEKLLGSALATPFGMDRDVWLLLLSLPVVGYASSIFFTGAAAALRARTLDMMVLVAVAIGTGWLYSVAATSFIEGGVFYEAAAMLATFVLLGHWFEMRARRRQRRDPRAARPRSAQGDRAARRGARRGADCRGRRRRHAARPPGREGARRRGGRGGRERGR
jgi:P-type Cu2+ transporter